MKIITVISILLIPFSLSAADCVRQADCNGHVYRLEDRNLTSSPSSPAIHSNSDNSRVASRTENVVRIVADDNDAEGHAGASKSHANPAQAEHPLTTKISITDGVITVPIILKNKGQNVTATMILDTGTAVTTLYSALASDLTPKIKPPEKMKHATPPNTAPDPPLLTSVDSIEMDNKSVAHSDVMVVPHTNFDADGVLGNSFLRFFNYTIDYENQLLRWN